MTAVLLALALLGSLPSAARAADTIRVALTEQARAVEFSGTRIEVVELAVCERCPLRAWRADVVRAVAVGQEIEIAGRRAGGFRLTSPGPITMNGREYPAVLDVVRNGQGLAVVNELPLEDYVAGVLRAEAPDSWPTEALRALAIAVRTYAAYHRRLGAGKAWDLVASTAHQLYAGRVATSSAAWAAAQETAGQVLLWEGALFPAFYHAESGGFTEDPRAVFAGRDLPALVPVVDPFSRGSPHYTWTLDLPLADLSETLRTNGVDVGRVRGIDVAERTQGLRVALVTVRGTRASARLRGSDFRRMVGYDTLRSTLFAVAVDGGVARFAGRGYGHGVGLCQWGAKGMAEQGYTAAQILAYYFRGATRRMLDGR